ncbi:hypothetical protein LC2W_0295 [Lacticaseibacillus paracasei]|nr:hypothetical protein LC2W_0295 [Lacticaseibacillus paracasei]AEA55804.1 hypothetical protein LCBD_0304 [Lacticaseibacillus paracasei]
MTRPPISKRFHQHRHYAGQYNQLKVPLLQLLLAKMSPLQVCPDES